MTKMLDSSSLSAFCEGMAMMLAAGIQTDEAVFLLAERMEPSPYKRACDDVYGHLIEGETLYSSMTAAGVFPKYILDMVRAGEESGRLENVLRSLAIYYSEEDRLFAKMHSAMAYPAALLAIMTVILLFTIAVILPVFLDVYQSISGGLFTGSMAYLTISMDIGFLAFALIALCTIVAIVAVVMSRGAGQATLTRMMERFPLTSDAMYHMALSRFTSALATYVSAGLNSDRALNEAAGMAEHKQLRSIANKTYLDMVNPENPKALPQAIYDNELFDPIHARMLMVGGRSGATETVLQNLSNTFFEDAVMRIDSLIDSIEPTLAAFLTIAVGATLLAVMLPLIGIMGSIG